MSIAAAVARAARRRLMVRLLVASLGPALLVAGAGSVVLVTLDKFTPWRFPLLVTLALPAVLAVPIAAGLAWRRRPTLLGAAGEVDAALRLRDKLSTTLVTDPRAGPFHGMAVDQGEQAARAVRVDHALPIRLGLAWRVWPAVLAAAAGAAIFMPEMSPAVRRAAEQRQRTMMQARTAAERVEEAAQVAAEANRDIPEASGEQLQTLRDLQRELEAAAEGRGGVGRPSTLTPDQAITQAAETLEQSAAAQQALAERQQAEAEAVQARMSELTPPGPAGSESPLARAIRGGDLEAARRAASELLREDRQQDAQTRARTAEDLARLAEELRQLAAAKTSPPPDAAPPPPAPQDHASAADAHSGEPQDAPGESTAGPDEQPAGASAPDKPPTASDQPADDAKQADATSDLQRNLADAARELDPAAAGRAEQAQREKSAEAVAEKRSTEPEFSRGPDKPPTPRDGSRSDGKQAQADRNGKGTEASREQGSDGKQAQADRSGKGTEGSREQGSDGKQAQASPRSSDRPDAVGDGRSSPTQQPGKPEPSTKPGSSAAEGEKPAAAEHAGERSQGQKPEPGGTSAPADTPRPAPDGAGQATPSSTSKPSQPSSSPSPDRGSSPSQASKPAPNQAGNPAPSQETGAAPDPSRPGQPTRAGAGARSEREPATPPNEPQPQAGPGPAQAEPAPEPRPGGDGRPDQAPPSPQQQRALERLAKELERMSKQPDAVRRHEKNADKLREQAQRLYDAASPEQKERMRRWVQDAARRQQDRDLVGGDDMPSEFGARGPGSTRGGGDPRRDAGRPAPDQPARTEPVDARAARVSGDEPANEQVVAEWLGRGGERHTPTDPEVVQGRLREAARSAERAIGDRTVPGRYDRILREYFKRLPDKLAPAPPTPAPVPAAEPARDGSAATP